MIDYAVEIPEVDHNRIALLGVSMGGYLAPRAAAYDHRIAALIALDGVYDLGDISTSPLRMPREEAERRLRAPEDPELDAGLAAAMANSPMIRWSMEHGMYALGAPTPRAFAAAYLDYNLRDGVAEQITCATLVCAGQEDGFFAGQPEKLYAALTCPKELLAFTAEDGGEAHCQSGAQRYAFGRIYDWLAEAMPAAC